MDLATIVAGLGTEATTEDIVRCWDRVIADNAIPGGVTGLAVLEVLREQQRVVSGVDHLSWGGSWVWRLSQSAPRAVVTAAFLGGLLSVGKIDGLPAVVLPTVLQMLFDFERISFSMIEKRLIRIVGIKSGVIDGGSTPLALYGQLPDNVKKVVDESSFFLFLEKLVRAGRGEVQRGRFRFKRQRDDAFHLRIE